MNILLLLIFLTTAANADEVSADTNGTLVPEQATKAPLMVRKPVASVSRNLTVPDKLDRAIAAALKNAAHGRRRAISRGAWDSSGLANEFGRHYGDFRTNEARMAAIDRLAWDRAGAEQMTGREYDEFEGDIARLCELVRSGIASGTAIGDGVSGKRSDGLPATPDVCETPEPGEGAVPQPEPNVGDTSGTSSTDSGESGSSKPGKPGGTSSSGNGGAGDAETGDMAGLVFGQSQDDADGSSDSGGETQDIVGPQGPGGPLPGPINSMSQKQAKSALRNQLANMILGRDQ